MKAIVQTRYGSPEILELREVDTPLLEDHQVLVRVHASSVNPAEWYRVVGPPFARVADGLRRPKRPGIGGDLAGTVVAVGKDVDDVVPGDEVFGIAAASWAEYARARADRVVRKPANASFEEAGAVPIAGLTALQALRDHGRVQPGQKVLINGASGGVGTFAVQIAKALGADVTAVCSTSKVELVRSLGADRVIDYTQEDFTRRGERYDVLIDVAGSRPFRQFARVLTREAMIVLVGGAMNRGLGPLPHLGATIASGLLRSQTVRFFVAKATKEDLGALAGLVEAGEIRAVVERRYELGRAADALRYLGEGHCRAKVVLTV
ncbi:MAG: NAD(P)-dependent alcohol dehydrogenase [Thermoleophilia bacterium]|nr:NAD(P)-dependent alcohol dehydrogenase [Thermoleophilia bacterium]